MISIRLSVTLNVHRLSIICRSLLELCRSSSCCVGYFSTCHKSELIGDANHLLQTLPDYVMSTRIVKWDGTVVKLIRADDPEGFKVNVLHFGLLGVTVGEILKIVQQ